MTTTTTDTIKYKKPDDFRGHIIHLEKLSLVNLISFLETWNNERYNINLTEKVDGMFLSFGIDHDGFFVGSKNTKKRSLNSINPNIYYLEPLRKAFGFLQNQDFKSILKFKETFSISCEWIPSHDYNIIQYDPQIIKNGLFVIYTIKIDEEFVKPTDYLCQLLNTKTSSQENEISFALNPVANLPCGDFTFDKKTITELKNLKHSGDQDKTILLFLMSETVVKFKEQFLRNMSGYKSKFGFKNDWEGVVFHTPNGRVKITSPVFVKNKDLNWNPIGIIDHELKMNIAELIKHSSYRWGFNTTIQVIKTTLLPRIKLNIAKLENKKTFYEAQNNLLPKKKNDISKYIELKKEKLKILECLMISAPDAEAMTIALKLFQKDKLDV
jgi:hypothetical protein